jgi:hypothetical protein
VEEMRLKARQREEDALNQQVEAARLRLLPELGQYLVAMGAEASDPNRAFYDLMNRSDLEGASRLKACHSLLGGYPEWDAGLLEELAEFAAELTENRRIGLISGTALEAARSDPRWEALVHKAK